MRLWLKELRCKAGLQQKQVAIKSGITQQQYNFIENGKRGITVNNAKKIAAALDFDWTKFFDNDDNAKS